MGFPFAKEKTEVPNRPSGVGFVRQNQPEPSINPGANADGDAALDALGAILRAFGANSFDVAELDANGVRQLFERWSAHVLVAAPLHPRTEDEEPETTGEEHARRNWKEVRQLVSSHRKREAAYVTTSLANLRSAVWSFVDIVNRAASQDKQDGVLARERLTSLQAALQCKDVETLRREVSQTASALESALFDQQKKQQQRLDEFASHVRTLGEQLETARREGTLDPLTRLPNRSCFDEFLGRTVNLAALVGRSVSLMMVDIDQFKTINDTVGHQAGDLAIRTIADCLVRRFPRRGDLVARYGGDEFAIVLGDTERKDARTLAERLVESVRATNIVHQGRKLKVTLSVGVAFFEKGDTGASWLSRADAALYQAKSQGRDRWVESIPEAATAQPGGPAGEPAAHEKAPARK